MRSVSLGTLVLRQSVETGAVGPDGVGWSLDAFSGWGGTGSTVSPTQRPRGHGAWAGQAWLQSRELTLTGSVWAASESALDAALHRLNTEASLSSATLTVDEVGSAFQVMVRRRGDVVWDRPAPRHARWSLDLVATDPRKFPASGPLTSSRPADLPWVNYSRDPSFEYGVGVLTYGTSVASVVQGADVTGDNGPGAGSKYAVVTGAAAPTSVQSFVAQFYGTGGAGLGLVAEGDFAGVGLRVRCPDGSVTHARVNVIFRTDAAVVTGQQSSGWMPVTAAPLADASTLLTWVAGPAPAATTRCQVQVLFASSSIGAAPPAGFVVHTDLWMLALAGTAEAAGERARVYFDGDGTVLL